MVPRKRDGSTKVSISSSGWPKRFGQSGRRRSHSKGGLVLGLSKLNRVLEVDLDNCVARVQPGVRNLAKSIGPRMETRPFYPIWAAKSSIEPNPLFRRKFLERTNRPWCGVIQWRGKSPGVILAP